MSEQFTVFSSIEEYEKAPVDIKEAQKTRDDCLIDLISYMDHIASSMPEERDYLLSVGKEDVKAIFKTVLPSIMKSQSAINQYNNMLDDVSNMICDSIDKEIPSTS